MKHSYSSCSIAILLFVHSVYADHAIPKNTSTHKVHHANELLTLEHIEKLKRMHYLAHLHDHQGDEKAANLHADDHNGDHGLAHLHDHNNNLYAASAHANDHME